ncbi:aromatic ring-hydroxylating dioxygenase subunit alpha [Halioglobus maricola]|uniref:Aromatic ring-hydroxylating dioxygenase subunit alpha n=1 Tax=Halioglobus maricola TaxID=2601894 RepID=A0A5P9NG40_9GAMM|nr:aromatic ring-hydroxylating dioxygenase subunit alpha [Halioglobus maricola]QFU74777.1 aromatic ring-hydroxylating dioxygenase subunit alpha [Halioglobus maricola]
MSVSDIYSTVDTLSARFDGKANGPAPCSLRIPVTNYTDPSRFERERLQLFQKMPILLAHESQIPEPGDSLVQDWLGVPLITIRDKNGGIATFFNVCRHRGMRLVQDEGQTNLRSLVCPYHQWTYGLDGELRNIPRCESFVDIAKEDNGLVPVATEVRNGLIWIQVRGEMDIDAHLAELGPEFDFFQLGQFHFCQQSVRDVPASWKLIQDAFLDGYHVTRLHKNTVGPFFPDALAETSLTGLHLRNAVARNEIEEAVGTPARELEDIRRHATFSYTTFPNAVLVMQPDYISVICLFPQAPDRTLFVHSMLVPEPPSSDEQREHFERSFRLIDEGVFAAEDIFVAVGAQQGFNCGANETLLFGGLEEAAAQFHQLIDEQLARN